MSNHPFKTAFFWQPENISLVTGETIEKPAHQWSAKQVITLIRVTVGLIGIILALIPALEQSRLLNSGASTEGYYTDRWRLGDERSGERYYLTYRFFVGAKDYLNRVSVSAEEYQRAEIGAKVTVYYHANDPSQSTIYRSTIKSDSIHVATAVIIFAIIIFGSLLYASWRQRLLQREGQLVEGRVTHTKNDVQRSGDCYLTVTFTFTSPRTGREIIHTIKRKWDERRAEPLPETGQMVYVHYRHDHHYQLL
ncbi:MAG: DUF3592 domain-containing protein [Anaerolineae bacterium]|nr:DUF3592 domain-containing protein [Anaerolineae bacterium]